MDMLKKALLNPQTPFWLITFSAMIGLTLPTLIQDGMFMDAMLYTSVSHNLSMGIGTFWFPKFSIYNVGTLPSFHEQPPLVFGIQSVFFKIFGDSMYVERFYTFLAMCITAMLILHLWNEIFNREKSLKSPGWLPVLLWITIPVCFWSFSNNMHENTMGIFTLSAVVLMYKASLSEKPRTLAWITAGIFIFLATLSKGLPGFFPVTVPFLYWIITKKSTFSKTAIQTVLILAVPVILYGILFIIPESRDSLSTYLFKRALHRINAVPTVDNRFWIFYRLFTELLPQIIFVVVIWSIGKFKKIKMALSENTRTALFFLAVGLSASAPLMLTLVQKGFYFVPALPFFAVGLSMLAAPIISNLTDRIITNTTPFKLLLLLSALLLAGTAAFAVMQQGKTSRDNQVLHDVYLIGKVVPRQTTVSIPDTMWNDFSLQCYLVRYFNISLDPFYRKSYYIIDRTMQLSVPADYQKVDIKTGQYDLYKYR
jgi:4-amino-4-deoxy-L-arabinose transferase-like glycosyltransferase